MIALAELDFLHCSCNVSSSAGIISTASGAMEFRKLGVFDINGMVALTPRGACRAVHRSTPDYYYQFFHELRLYLSGAFFLSISVPSVNPSHSLFSAGFL